MSTSPEPPLLEGNVPQDPQRPALAVPSTAAVLPPTLPAPTLPPTLRPPELPPLPERSLSTHARLPLPKLLQSASASSSSDDDGIEAVNGVPVITGKVSKSATNGAPRNAKAPAASTTTTTTTAYAAGAYYPPPHLPAGAFPPSHMAMPSAYSHMSPHMPAMYSPQVSGAYPPPPQMPGGYPTQPPPNFFYPPMPPQSHMPPHMPHMPPHPGFGFPGYEYGYLPLPVATDGTIAEHGSHAGMHLPPPTSIPVYAYANPDSGEVIYYQYMAPPEVYAPAAGYGYDERGNPVYYAQPPPLLPPPPYIGDASKESDGRGYSSTEGEEDVMVIDSDTTQGQDHDEQDEHEGSHTVAVVETIERKPPVLPEIPSPVAFQPGVVVDYHGAPVRVIWSKNSTGEESVRARWLAAKYIGDAMMVAEFLASYGDFLEAAAKGDEEESDTASTTAKQDNTVITIATTALSTPATPTKTPSPSSTSDDDRPFVVEVVQRSSPILASRALAETPTPPLPTRPRPIDPATALEHVILTLLDNGTSTRFHEMVARLLAPLIVITYKDASFEAVLVPVRAATGLSSSTTSLASDQRTNSGLDISPTSPASATSETTPGTATASALLARISYPALAANMPVDACAVVELLLMYVRNNMAKFRAFMNAHVRVYGSFDGEDEPEEGDADVEETPVDGELPEKGKAEEVAKDDEEARQQEPPATAESDTSSNSSSSSSTKAKERLWDSFLRQLLPNPITTDTDRLSILPPRHRLAILTYLIRELMDTAAFTDELDARFAQLADLERQSRRDNVELRGARKEAAAARREIRMRMLVEERAMAEERRTVDGIVPTTESGVVDVHETEAEDSVEEEPVAPVDNVDDIAPDMDPRPAPSTSNAAPVTAGDENRAAIDRLVSHERQLIQRIAFLSGTPITLPSANDSAAADTADMADTTFERILHKRISINNRPLGRDRYGREYWMFTSVRGLFLHIDRFTRENMHVDSVGEAVALPSDGFIREWYWFPEHEAFLDVLNALDVRGMRFGAELQLYRSLSRWQDYALDIQAKAKVAPSTAIRATPSPLIPATHAYTTLRRLARHIFLPILSQSRLYAHFTDLLPGINNWLSGIPSKLATVAIDGLSPFEACKQAVLDFYDLCHGSCAGSSLGSKRKSSERRAKNSKNGRFNKSSASSRTTTAQLSPLAFAFLEHGKTHRPIDVKSVDKSLSQWRQFVSDCDNAERLYFAVRLLYDHVCAETEDNGAYEERPGVDPLAVVEESSSSEEDVDVAKRTLREAGSTRPLRRNKRLKK